MRWKIVAALLLTSALLAPPAVAGLAEGEAAFARRDWRTAARELQPLAEQGNARAQYLMGGIALQGASPGRILRQIQLPLATPTIMAGVNPVIMLSLSMVVIAGMVGAGGLGREVVASLNRIDIGLGFEAGLSVVIIAIFLDRLTASFGSGRGYFGRLADLLGGGRRRQDVETDAAKTGPRRAPTAV